MYISRIFQIAELPFLLIGLFPRVPASYVYLTLPATTQQKVRDFDSRSVHIIRNDKKAQAAVINDLCYASVYHPTNLLIDNDNPIAISEPGTYIIHIKKKEIVSHESFALQLTNK